ncbi:hypothetical protein Pmani_009962 [Petrolisthes manimaculis]|uniref:Reverse transcriptase domain-containing protein n=1 Tax=Petrolisthes manimaculis TaxID=1843537 RepID=A0AAE1UCE2_9EUCA|nr:hypothetical protein Pmani_009962 [Petrolisthes manimaculis]
MTAYEPRQSDSVTVNGSLSEWSTVSSGVPQGSVLGPLLFTMFVSDVPNLLDNYISLFADDIKIYQVLGQFDHQQFLHGDLNKAQTNKANKVLGALTHTFLAFDQTAFLKLIQKPNQATSRICFCDLEPSTEEGQRHSGAGPTESNAIGAGTVPPLLL